MLKYFPQIPKAKFEKRIDIKIIIKFMLKNVFDIPILFLIQFSSFPILKHGEFEANSGQSVKSNGYGNGSYDGFS